MAKAKSQTFFRTILLVLFVVFMASLEIAAKQDNSISARKSKEGNKISFFRHQFCMRFNGCMKCTRVIDCQLERRSQVVFSEVYAIKSWQTEYFTRHF